MIYVFREEKLKLSFSVDLYVMVLVGGRSRGCEINGVHL